MQRQQLGNISGFFNNLRLNQKIQLSLMLIILPLFVLFAVIFTNMLEYNRQYDKIIANASEAGRFSINFKEEFDYKIYLLIAGHSSFNQENPYQKINEAYEIVTDLLNNTSIEENKHRAESIIKLLGNLEKYIKRIEQNKREGGHYDDNISIWENDVQLVTALIQSTVLEYTYYETKGMEQLRAEVSASLEEIKIYGISVFTVLVAAAILISFIIPNSLARPIRHLCDVTNQVACGNLAVRANVTAGAEVKKLADSFNLMVEKLESLLLAVKTEQQNLRAAELELLQAQINPHFLYNTLDTIIWLAEAGKHSEVVEMVGSLSDFFRSSLSCGNEIVTLREEERHIRSYLQIQQVRYQDILEYEINIKNELLNVIIPKITLQPLIENALYHGIKNRRGKGRIAVNAVKIGDAVEITIEDNGIGIPPERLKAITDGIENKGLDKNAGGEKHEAFGLYNVNERIRLRFGSDYGIAICSKYGEGTTVTVKIPFLN